MPKDFAQYLLYDLSRTISLNVVLPLVHSVLVFLPNGQSLATLLTARKISEIEYPEHIFLEGPLKQNSLPFIASFE